MSAEAKEKLHERVSFGTYGAHGDAHIIIHEGEQTLYLGLATAPVGGLGSMLTGRLSVPDVEALIALLQKGVAAVKENIAAKDSLAVDTAPCAYCHGTREHVVEHPIYGDEVTPCPDCEGTV